MLNILRGKSYIFFSVILLAMLSCSSKNNYTPKPKGYYRIDFPEKKYEKFTSDCPYTFEYPVYSEIIRDPENTGNDCWLNIHFPYLNGDIHLSYKKVNGNLQTYIEDSRNLAYKHTIKAEAIGEQVYKDQDKDVYGIMYDLKGNVASPLQFFMTDSSEHFIRGSLYFRTEPNKDSLAPVIDFVKQDIRHLIETIKWKKQN
jgi:gliding motility-associated lipoprotein GldD